MLLIALLHVLAYWATSSTINVPIAHKATAFEWVFISPPRAAEPIRSTTGDVGMRSATPPLAPTPLTTPFASPDDSPHDLPTGQSATDWNSELERAAKSTASGDESAQRRDFGFPHRAPSTKTPTFDWDRVHTHRVEIGPEGGVIIHLSDNCVMVFMPLPFALCGIGKKEANGHLLDHMNDSPVADAPTP
jgi:hypothetical protein